MFVASKIFFFFLLRIDLILTEIEDINLYTV